MKIESKIWNKAESKTIDSLQVNMKMPNPSQEPPESSKAPNEDLKDMVVLCTFKIKIESNNSDHGSTKDSDHIQIKIKMPNPSQEPPVSSKVQNQDLKDMDVFCNLKFKIEHQNSEYRCIKEQ